METALLLFFLLKFSINFSLILRTTKAPSFAVKHNFLLHELYLNL